MEATTKSKWLKIFQKHSLIIVLLVALGLINALRVFQTFLHLTESESAALNILLIAAALWVTEAIPLYITGLIILLLQLMWLLPLLEAAQISIHEEEFYLAFFSDITLLFLGGFVLSALLNRYGLARMVARWILLRTGGKPANVLLGIIAVSSLLSMWMSNTATAAMMLAIVTPLISQLPETSRFSKAIAIAIPFACNLGGLGTPIGTPPNAIAIGYLTKNHIAVSFIDWMLLCVPIMAILLFLLWKTLLKFFPPDDDVILEIEQSETKNFTLGQYVVLAIFGLTIFGWVTSDWTGISTGTVGLMVVIVSFGLQLLKIPDFRNISWDILFMLGGGLCLGVGLGKSGLTDTIAAAIPTEGSFWIVFTIVVALTALMTTFMSNTATANLLLPIALSLPQNQLILAIAIAIMCSSAMALPISTPPNAIAFGSGILKIKDMLNVGLVITFLALAAVFIAAAIYFPLFF